jgi:thiamine biosynthesis protein ThiC
MWYRTPFCADAECLTQMHLARRGIVSAEMERVAEREDLPGEVICEEVVVGG